MDGGNLKLTKPSNYTMAEIQSRASRLFFPQTFTQNHGALLWINRKTGVSKMKQEGEHFTLRMVEDGCPAKSARPVQPNPVVFLYYCRGRHDTSDAV